jgi:hypothetical protein
MVLIPEIGRAPPISWWANDQAALRRFGSATEITDAAVAALSQARSSIRETHVHRRVGPILIGENAALIIGVLTR